MSRIAISTLLLANFALLTGFKCTAEEVSLPGIERTVEVYYDGYGIPHVYAESWTDAYRALGHIHATERLWQMDMFRRKASGTSAEILGKEELGSDILMRQLGMRRGCEEIVASDRFPRQMHEELSAYCEGVNACIAELGSEGLPPMFHALGYEPEPWNVVDCIVFGKYMGWDQSGTDDDLWLGMMAEKLGPEIIDALWPLDRPFEVPSIKMQVDRDEVAQSELTTIPRATAAYQATLQKLKSVTSLTRGESFGSNNWAVDGTKTASGKPIFCSDPHLGFSLPSLWYTCHLCVNGQSIVGVTFPGSPITVIGHNDYLGWGITNMQADSVDYFVETINPDDPMQYKHRGEWKPIARITEEIPVRGESPHTLHVDSTVHGPIVNRDGRAISVQWSGLGGSTEMVGFWEMARAKKLDEFLTAAEKITVPGINLAYADVHGTIAMHSCGDFPIRLPGQGRIPMDGSSGEFDWHGLIPRDELPLAVNPEEHFVASANGRPASIGYPYYLGWMWDPSYRIRRINDMLTSAEGLTIESMGVIQNDAHDKAAERYLPILCDLLKESPPQDAYARQVANVLQQWDYVASTDALAPIAWLRWMDHYRNGVWDDEWRSRGIEKRGGSWGYTGNNRREPILEVLEFLTRKDPTSIWFDDRGTPEIETRDDIALRAFEQTTTELNARFGEDVSALKWGDINQLKVRSMTGESSLERRGGPVPGTSFTVNPGSGGGTVGGGASFRMIIDFGDPSTSIGVYPGGQSENPESKHYDDQIPLWATGKYAPLHMVADANKLPAEAKQRSTRFVPKH